MDAHDAHRAFSALTVIKQMLTNFGLGALQASPKHNNDLAVALQTLEDTRKAATTPAKSAIVGDKATAPPTATGSPTDTIPPKNLHKDAWLGGKYVEKTTAKKMYMVRANDKELDVKGSYGNLLFGDLAKAEAYAHHLAGTGEESIRNTNALSSRWKSGQIGNRIDVVRIYEVPVAQTTAPAKSRHKLRS